jgi:hypothetical protein
VTEKIEKSEKMSQWRFCVAPMMESARYRKSYLGFNYLEGASQVHIGPHVVPVQRIFGIKKIIVNRTPSSAFPVVANSTSMHSCRESDMGQLSIDLRSLSPTQAVMVRVGGHSA